MPKIASISEVVSSRLCIGCGACAYASSGAYRMIDYPEEGIRPYKAIPIIEPEVETACLSVCPSVQIDYSHFDNESSHPDLTPSFKKKWGHITESWEGYATDPEIRFKGSSGGALTAISAYCIEKLGMTGTLHIAQDPQNATRNKTTLSKTRDDLMAAAGSRYSPASVCDGLRLVEEAASPCVIVGKPAEIAAVRNTEKIRPALKSKVGVTLSFFCAETPPTRATEELVKELKVDRSNLTAVRYRGHGWPGYFTTTDDQDRQSQHLIYQKSWAYLQKFRPWSTQIWPDGSGELADISCGDPWYEEPDGENPGFSLVLARSRKGKEIIEGAMATGYLNLEKAELWKIEASQIGLLRKKASTHGRRLAMRTMGMPTTRFVAEGSRFCWSRLSSGDKFKTYFGTLRRIIQRNLRQPLILKNDSE